MIRKRARTIWEVILVADLNEPLRDLLGYRVAILASESPTRRRVWLWSFSNPPGRWANRVYRYSFWLLLCAPTSRQTLAMRAFYARLLLS